MSNFLGSIQFWLFRLFFNTVFRMFCYYRNRFEDIDGHRSQNGRAHPFVIHIGMHHGEERIGTLGLGMGGIQAAPPAEIETVVRQALE